MESVKTRFNALDGLRGLAIILVFLNHISSTYILQSTPFFLKPFAETFTSSGRTAVSIFFLLSGFLMAYFYPVVTDKMRFLQKRYTRIFPLFLTMVAVRTFFRNAPQYDWYIDMGILIMFPVIAHMIWVYGIQKINKPLLSRSLFFGFITLQIIVGLWYLMGIMRHPAIDFNQLTSPIIRETSITLVNATLTLPLGDYIPMLDGVYWSLVAEVFFYIIFPFTFAPIASYLQTKSRFMITLFLLALIPFFLGLDLLSKKIMVLSMLDIPFFYYFVLGITTAYIIKNERPWLRKVENYMNHKYMGYALATLLIIILVILHQLFTSTSREWYPIIRIVGGFPLAFIFLVILMKESSLSRLFRARWLMFLGTISYSMYLVHTCVVDLAKRIYTPDSLMTNAIFVFSTFVIVLFLSILLFKLLEKPYFIAKKSEAKALHSEKNIQQISVTPIIISLLIFYLILIVTAFQSNFNFFSIDKKYQTNTIVSPPGLKGSLISLREHPIIRFRFIPQENNMGIITMDMQYATTKISKKFINREQNIIFRIRETGTKSWLSEASYKPAAIGMSKNHPFGFPLIADAKGREFEAELVLTDPELAEYVNINTSDSFFKSIHQLPKSQVLKSPTSLYLLLSNRVTNIITNAEAYKAFLMFLPFFMMSSFLLTQDRLADVKKISV